MLDYLVFFIVKTRVEITTHFRSSENMITLAKIWGKKKSHRCCKTILKYQHAFCPLFQCLLSAYIKVIWLFVIVKLVVKTCL